MRKNAKGKRKTGRIIPAFPDNPSDGEGYAEHEQAVQENPAISKDLGKEDVPDRLVDEIG